MRLWHKDLIHVLPRQQLIAQWRECCCIAKNIADKGTPNHILVNKVLDYTVNHFTSYTELVLREMFMRGYKVSSGSISRFYLNLVEGQEHFKESSDNLGVEYTAIYYDWHNTRYFWQCYHNLQEKYDCGGISKEEWEKTKAEIRKKVELEQGVTFESITNMMRVRQKKRKQV